MVETCRICGSELDKENRVECSNCGKIVCKECVRFEKSGPICEKCIKENKMPEIDWK